MDAINTPANPEQKTQASPLTTREPQKRPGTPSRDLGRFGGLLGARVKRPAAYWGTLACCILAGSTMSWWAGSDRHATARITRKLHPLVAEASGQDWANLLRLDVNSLREQVLSAENIVRAAISAGVIEEKDAEAAQANPAAALGLIREVRGRTLIDIAHVADSLDVLQLDVAAPRLSADSKFVNQLAHTYADSIYAAQKAEAERAVSLASQQALEAEKRVASVATSLRLVAVEREISDLDDQLKTLGAMRNAIQEAMDVPTPGQPKPSHVNKIWEPILEWEKFLHDKPMTAEERKRAVRMINEMKRNASQSTGKAASTDAAGTAAGTGQDTVKLAEIESEMKNRERKVAERRQELARIEAAIGGPRTGTLTVELLEKELADEHRKERELESKAEHLKSTLAAVTSHQAVEFTIEASEPITRLSGVRFGLMLCLTLALSGIAARGAVWLAEVRDTTFHSLDEARHHLEVPVLGVVPIASIYPQGRSARTLTSAAR